MDDETKIKLIKIIQNSKKKVFLSDFGIEYYNLYSLDEMLEYLLKFTKDFELLMSREQVNFNKEFENTDDFLKAIEGSFRQFNKGLEKIVCFRNDLSKRLVADMNDLEYLLSFKVLEKILNDYILWCDKVINFILNVDANSQILYEINIEKEISMINILANNDKIKNKSCLLPILAALGFGYWLG